MDVPVIDAIYSAEFALNDKTFGSGILVFNEGQIHGGDSLYVYKGCYSVGEGCISAAVVVDRYKDTSKSALDLPTHFRLILNGAATIHDLTLMSAVDGKAEQSIRIDLKRISELDDH